MEDVVVIFCFPSMARSEKSQLCDNDGDDREQTFIYGFLVDVAIGECDSKGIRRGTVDLRSE